jgi:hypothetical protein
MIDFITVYLCHNEAVSHRWAEVSAAPAKGGEYPLNSDGVAPMVLV